MFTHTNSLLAKCLIAIAMVFMQSSVFGHVELRVATYNIRWFDDKASQERLHNLIEVIENLDADVIGLQEISDRKALRQIFPSPEWQIVIDDESNQKQDLALAIRSPWSGEGSTSSNINAEDYHFLFPASGDNSYFLGRRDVLAVEIVSPNDSSGITIMVQHAKSRYGGRASNEWQRVGASKALLSLLEKEFDETFFIYIGDLNDNPDDASLNILESGNPSSRGGPEQIDGPFMMNLTEDLMISGHVSHGLNSRSIENDQVNTIDLESRGRNNDGRGSNLNTGKILFDQILISASFSDTYVSNSVTVFDHTSGVRGNRNTRASDHVPVYADFIIGNEEPVPSPIPSTSLRISGLLPNPNGKDAGNEAIRLLNLSTNDISLSGWYMVDRASNRYGLSGLVPAGVEFEIIMSGNRMPLNNSGDDITLFDDSDNHVFTAMYSGSDVEAGIWIIVNTNGSPNE